MAFLQTNPDGSLLIQDGKLVSSEECCCDNVDPCSCLPDYADVFMPDSATIETPWGDFAMTKSGGVLIGDPDCAPGCYEIDGSNYVEWKCIYLITPVDRVCETSVMSMDKFCEGTPFYDEEQDTTFKTTQTLDAELHCVLESFIPWTSGGYEAKAIIRRRLNCATGQWETKVSLYYVVLFVPRTYLKGTHTTRHYEDGVLVTTDVLEYYAGVTDFCEPFDDTIVEVANFWNETGFPACQQGGAAIVAETAWIPTSPGVDAPVTFDTQVESATLGGNYAIVEFLAPTGDASGYLDCDPLPFGDVAFENNVSYLPGMVNTLRCSSTDTNSDYEPHTITFP